MTLTRETVEQLLADATQGPWGWKDDCELFGFAGEQIIAHASYEGMWFACYGDPEKDEATRRMLESAPDLATTLLAAWDERDAMQRSQTYSYIGRDGKTVLARDLEDRAEAAEAKLAERDAEIARLRETLDNLLDAITATDQIGDRVLSITGSTANLKWLIETIEDSRAALNKEPNP